MRGRWKAAAVMLVAGALTTAAVAYAATEIPTRTAAASESAPTATAEYLVWTQNTVGRPRHYDTYARLGTAPRFRVNPAGTQGFRGAVTGSRLVFQQVTGTRSDLRLYNLVTKRRTAPPAGVNTAGWEWSPTASGNWILFGRVARLDNVQSVFLFNLVTRARRLLARTTGRGSLLPGQVNGDYAVWTRCAAQCNVFRHRLSKNLTSRVPNPFGKDQYAPSVAGDGTVYFARSGRACGSSVRLLRRAPGKDATGLLSLPAGVDLSSTFARDDAEGATSVFYDRGRCRNGRIPNQDIYRIIEKD